MNPGMRRGGPVARGDVGFNEQAGRIRALESIRMPIGHEMSAVAIVVVSLSAFVQSRGDLRKRLLASPCPP